MTNDYIIRTATNLITRHGTRDPYELCDAMHIHLHRIDMQRRIKGFYYYQSRQRNIVIDSNVNETLERILIAHELGHAVLHGEIAAMRGFQEMEVLERDNARPMENEANLFAAELLLPDEEVLEHLESETFFDTARALHVPAALLDYKFVALRTKGYMIRPMDMHPAGFLGGEIGAYDDTTLDND